MTISAPRIVLVRPSHPGNIGACARAMKVMGLSSLYLVSPKKFPDEEATSRAAHAEDILENACVVSTLPEALEEITFVYASSANVRDEDLPMLNPREAALDIHQKNQHHKHHTAILFGPENYGLSHEDLLHAHALICIPTADYHSLNLAAAVQVIAYEYYYHTRNNQEKQAKIATDLASMTEMESFYQHLENVLIALTFLDPAKPRQLMTRLRRLFNRAHLTQIELNILRGILKSILSPLK